jgi:hypothetical protein
MPSKEMAVFGRRGTRAARIKGRIVGDRDCNLESCRGVRFAVRWPNGKLTWPCTRGMEVTRSGDYQII